MEAAKEEIHLVFLEFAASSPRFVALRGGTPLELSLQKDIYSKKAGYYPRFLPGHARFQVELV